MKRSDYMKRLADALNTGRITAEAYDASMENIYVFCDDDEEETGCYDNLPEWYAEVEYDDMDSPEALAGCRFDDMNYLHYMER